MSEIRGEEEPLTRDADSFRMRLRSRRRRRRHSLDRRRSPLLLGCGGRRSRCRRAAFETATAASAAAAAAAAAPPGRDCHFSECIAFARTPPPGRGPGLDSLADAGCQTRDVGRAATRGSGREGASPASRP